MCDAKFHNLLRKPLIIPYIKSNLTPTDTWYIKHNHIYYFVNRYIYIFNKYNTRNSYFLTDYFYPTQLLIYSRVKHSSSTSINIKLRSSQNIWMHGLVHLYNLDLLLLLTLFYLLPFFQLHCVLLGSIIAPLSS